MKTAISNVKVTLEIIIAALLLFLVLTMFTSCASTKVDTFDQMMKDMAPTFFIEGGSEE